MKVLITVAAWGEKYTDLLANYSINSQLSVNNLPRVATQHDVTYHIVTTAAGKQGLLRQPSVRNLERHCHIFWDLMEDHGIDPKRAPSGTDGRKYPFLSRLQNLAFNIAHDYDLIIFNYADFVWADGSLDNAIAMLRPDADAVLGFCLPLTYKTGAAALDAFRGDAAEIRGLSPRKLAEVARDHLHSEARLRIWTSKDFTSGPTYLLWPVGSDGILIRAYHQTVLVLRVKHGDPQFRRGLAI